MILEFLHDIKWMTLGGIIMFFSGFIIRSEFIIFLGLSTVLTGYTVYSIVDKEYAKAKK